MDVLLFYRPFLGRPPVASVWSRFSLAYHRLDWQQGRGGGNQLTAPTLDHRLIIRTERLIERTGSLIKGRRTTPANRLNKFPVNWARLSHTTDRGSGGPFHRLGPPPVLAVIYLTAPPPPTPNPTLGWTSAYVSYELWPIITRCPPSGFARVERVLLVTPLPLI